MKYYIGNIPYGNDLTHFGIKGMHWGIRRFQNPDGTLTPAGKARYGRYGDYDSYKALSKLKKGSTVYRSSVNPNETVSSGRAMYVSGTQVDRNHYRGGGGAQWLRNTSGNPNADIYEYEYKLKENLKTANREDVRRVYEQLKASDKRIEKESKETFVKGNPIVRNLQFERDSLKKHADAIVQEYGEVKAKELLSEYDKEYADQIKRYTKLLIENYGKLSSEDIFDYAGARSVGRHEYTKQRLISELKKQGFNSMIDQASVGTRVVREGVAPLIIFNPDKTIEVKGGPNKVSRSKGTIAGNKYTQWQQGEYAKMAKYNKKHKG